MPSLLLHLRCRENPATPIVVSVRSFAPARTMQNFDSDWQTPPNSPRDDRPEYVCCASHKSSSNLFRRARSRLVCQAILPTMCLDPPAAIARLLFLHKLLF